MKKIKRKVKRTVSNFKSGYSAGRRPGLHKASRAFDTVSNLAGVATGGPVGLALGLGGAALQLRDMNKVGSKAGRVGRKVGGAVRTAKQKAALKKAQLASARKRRK